jgi:hypothetical protein
LFVFFEKWVDMKEKFQEALELIEPENNKLKKTVWGQFWSSHQRFFKYLCMACKVPYVVELARKAISNNKCVVIGLQSTGKKVCFYMIFFTMHIKRKNIV